MLSLEPDERERKLKKLWIYFFDTADLDLFNHKIILRARKKKDDSDESTVKIRGIDPSQDFSKWKSVIKLEGDWVGDRVLRSASLTVEQNPGEIDQVANKTRDISCLFSKEQEQFVEDILHIPLKFDDLEILGPVEVRRWKKQPDDFDQEICVECWEFPDGKDIVELSVKVEPNQAVSACNAFERYLKQLGLNTDVKQEAKAFYALKYFADIIKN